MNERNQRSGETSTQRIGEPASVTVANTPRPRRPLRVWVQTLDGSRVLFERDLLSAEIPVAIELDAPIALSDSVSVDQPLPAHLTVIEVVRRMVGWSLLAHR